MNKTPGLKLSLASLLLLLQRTPALRVAAEAAEFAAPSRIVAVLKAAFTTAASLGAVQSMAGATQLVASQPSPVTVTTGAAVQIALVVTGAQTPAASWTVTGLVPPGLTLSGVTSGNVNVSTLILAGTTTTPGTYTITLRAWEKINATGDRSSLFPYTVIVAGAAATGPTLTTQPQSQYVAPGAAVTLSVGATGPGLTYQWTKDGVAIAGATQAGYAIAAAGAETMGFYAATVTGTGGSVDSAIATVTVNTGTASRLINVSTRGFVPAGGALTPGFVLQGNAAKSVVIRAVGPTLGSFGVGGTLSDPVLDVIPLGSSAVLLSNDNWGGGAVLQSAFSRVGAFPLAAPASTDASIETALAATGASGYTVRITGKSAIAAGIALAEVYDEEPLASAVRLVNVSTMGFVGTGEQALVPGFVIGGTAPKLLLIRAVGPGLAPFGVTGVLADPQLSVVPLGREFTVAASDNWGGGAALAAAFAQAAAFALPASSRDAAVVVRLPPGGYTVVVSGVGATTGTALVEVYDLDP